MNINRQVLQFYTKQLSYRNDVVVSALRISYIGGDTNATYLEDADCRAVYAYIDSSDHMCWFHNRTFTWQPVDLSNTPWNTKL